MTPAATAEQPDVRQEADTYRTTDSTNEEDGMDWCVWWAEYGEMME